MEAQTETALSLKSFVSEFGEGLLNSAEQLQRPIYLGEKDQNPNHNLIMDGLIRQPFEKQRDRVHAMLRLLLHENHRAVILNAEMGTGKTMMGICASEVLSKNGYPRTLVISPPHLVYKWRREIMNTVPDARVWVLNGPDTLAKLVQLRQFIDANDQSDVPEYFVLGRVRMRMGFNWSSAFQTRQVKGGDIKRRLCTCPDCGSCLKNEDNEFYTPGDFPQDKKLNCASCHAPLWQLVRPKTLEQSGRQKRIKKALMQLPTIGEKRASKLIALFGEEALGEMLEDNIYELINLFDDNGEFVFSDRQATRIERAVANLEFSFGVGGYQATEYIKRYLPQGYFGTLIVDEGHEYKNDGSAQGQAMGVLSMKCSKVVLLTGTLMGGYADDLFYLFWRLMPNALIEEGLQYRNGSLGSASQSFLRKYGILRSIYKSTDSSDHKTAKGSKTTVSTRKAPGFSPVGITRLVLPYTVFLRLSDLGENVLPPFKESLIHLSMSENMAKAYQTHHTDLTARLRSALAKGDRTLLGTVLNSLLAWPDCCFRPETVTHPRDRRDILSFITPLYDDDTPTPKEEKLIEICKSEKTEGRRVLVYTTYTGKRDTATRLRNLLTDAGLKVAVLRSNVDTQKREDWILDQVDRGVDIVICNPELVKTGLDLLEFPTLIFMQTGFNVYTVQQAARRSWRIGQTEDVKVYYFGYNQTAQSQCLSLMASKIKVSQSTSGEIPESGLESLNTEDQSLESELANTIVSNQ